MEAQNYYQMRVQNTRTQNEWTERLSEFSGINPMEKPIENAKAVIEFFNSTLRHGEDPRKLIAVEKVEIKVDQVYKADD